MSASSCDGLEYTYQAMFPDSEIAKKFSLGPTKFRYLITDGLAPYYEERLTEDVKRSPGFILSFDETTNSESKKELQTRLRYFSENDQEIVDRHLRTYFLGSATSEIIARYLNDSIKDFPKEKLIMLCSDGPNVNKAVWNLMNNDMLKYRSKGLLNIGTCNLHIVNNSFVQALSEFGSDASEFAIAVYYFFHNEPVRCEDYEKIQYSMKVPKHRFIKHSIVRWLTLKKSVLILDEQWPALIEYFLKFLPNKQGVSKSVLTSVRYTSICKYLRQSDMPIQLRFVASSAELFDNFSQLFQKEEPLIHVLFEKIETLVLTLAGRICTAESLLNFKSNRLKSEQLFEKENFVNLQAIILDEDVKKHLKNLNEKEILIVLTKVREHYKRSGSHILKKSSLKAYPHSSILYACRCLQPKRIRNKYSAQDICKIAEQLPLQGISSSKLSDEWKLLQLEVLPEFKKDERIDHYWVTNVFGKENCTGGLKYPLITQVVKISLSLSHGNADVERGFSKSKLILTKDKTSMSERTLNARLIIHDATKRFKGKLHLLPLTDALLNKVYSARQSYMKNLENERMKKEQIIEAEKKEKQRIELEKENLKNIETLNRKVKDLEADLKELKKQKNLTKNSSDILIDKAKTLLDEALKKNDLQAAHVARGMMAAAENTRTEERTKEEEISKLSSEIEQKKRKVLSTLLRKKKMNLSNMKKVINSQRV